MDDISPSDLKTILHSKRANLYYLQYCWVLVNGGRVEYVTDAGKQSLYWNIPIANTTTILLGTGTSITQAAMRELAKAGDWLRALGFGDPEAALLAAAGPIDLIIVNVAAHDFDGLRVIAKAKSGASARRAPILAVIDPGDRPRMVKALELGAHDLLIRPIDPEELAARVRTQVRRKRYGDFLREKLDYSLEMAVTDPLTGLHNRRYMTGQLQALVGRASHGGSSVAVLVLDIDHFKAVNDGFGHDAGDEVLREFAVRLATNVRAIDLPCRMGGEEFVVVMPGASLDDAHRVAERIRRDVASAPFRVMGGAEHLTVTISIGVAATTFGDTPDGLLKRADEGVYQAKAAGRNTVIARAA